MYFNKKSDTNIDDEFKKESLLSRSLDFISKYKKIFLFVLGIIILLTLMIVLFINRKITNYLILNGDDVITIYQGSDYIEPGYEAHNSKEENLLSEVVISSNLNNDVIGEYKITYTLGDITKTRIVNVIEKPKEYIFIYLNTVNNNVNVYLKKGETYTEPGYQVISSTGTNLTDRVTVTGEVDTSKKGTYKLVYSIVDSNNVTISASRMVIVMDSEISLTLENNKYTNKEVTINAVAIDEYFDYMLLPDNTKVTKSSYSYKVNTNGKYTFKIYSKKGNVKESTIEVKNIDKVAPSGSCTIDQYENNSVITIKASDNSGINKYVYNGKEYTNKKINVSEIITNAKVTVYDNAGNNKLVSCKITPKVYINSISNDGVIVTVNAKKIQKEISGYYFSYTNKRPDKNTGGYLATSNETLDVVRLPGTTYVWVEDESGKISEPKNITISSDTLLNTNGTNYKIVQNIKLDAYLKNQGWSLDELNKLIARSARAAGMYSKEAAATSAIAFQTVLAQKYQVKLPYWWGGKSWSYGASASWGSYKYTSNSESGMEYYYYGLDCSGFVAWAYVNAGYNIKDGGPTKYPKFWDWKRLTYNPDNAEVGDFLVNSGHIRLIVAKTNDGFITAEAKGKNYGMVVTKYKYSNANGYKVVSADTLMTSYDKLDMSSYPTGF